MCQHNSELRERQCVEMARVQILRRDAELASRQFKNILSRHANRVQPRNVRLIVKRGCLNKRHRNMSLCCDCQDSAWGRVFTSNDECKRYFIQLNGRKGGGQDGQLIGASNSITMYVSY